MKRDMYYQNVNQGYSNPGMYMPPSGYTMNTNYQAYGPNIMPNTQYQNGYYTNDNNLEERINNIEKQIRNLDTRLQKLESTTTNDNVYMI